VAKHRDTYLELEKKSEIEEKSTKQQILFSTLHDYITHIFIFLSNGSYQGESSNQ
jgi:hypothetical protein